MSEWQPIETAPRDGSVFLAHLPGHSKPFFVTWHRGGWVDYDDFEGWVSGRAPTHWMPLPEPPK